MKHAVYSIVLLILISYQVTSVAEARGPDKKYFEYIDCLEFINSWLPEAQRFFELNGKEMRHLNNNQYKSHFFAMRGALADWRGRLLFYIEQLNACTLDSDTLKAVQEDISEEMVLFGGIILRISNDLDKDSDYISAEFERVLRLLNDAKKDSYKALEARLDSLRSANKLIRHGKEISERIDYIKRYKFIREMGAAYDNVDLDEIERLQKKIFFSNDDKMQSRAVKECKQHFKPIESKLRKSIDMLYKAEKTADIIFIKLSLM